MASLRISALGDASPVAKPTDMLAVDRTTGTSATTKATLAQLFAAMGIAAYTVATLPTGATGRIIFVSDGRKAGEGSSAGTGVVCQWNGSNWITADAGTTVAS